jgi:hypothetical protein
MMGADNGSSEIPLVANQNLWVQAYRIYIPEQHKIEVSKDVTFNERMAFKKSIEEVIEVEELEEPNEKNTENENNEKDQPDNPMEPC